MSIRSIFKKRDFKVCNVPVPEGYPQSQTHAGIAYVPQKLGGFSYWLVSSPFPNKRSIKIILYFKIRLKHILDSRKREIIQNSKKKKRGEDYENPMLYFGNEEKNGEPVVNFVPFEGNPLMDKPVDLYGGGTFCSDPDIFIESSNIYILNRETYRNYYYSSTNSFAPYLRVNLIIGKIEKNKFTVKRVDTKFTDNDLACSPCLTKYKNQYHYIYLVTNSYNDGKEVEKMVVRSDNSIDGEFIDRKNIKIVGGKFIPWHISVFTHNETLYAIVACIKKGKKGRCYQMLGEFDNDLEKLTIFQKPLTNLRSYRGAAFVREDGVFVLYSTTVHEKIIGSKSVDGRDIIMTYKPFNELLKELKHNHQ